MTPDEQAKVDQQTATIKAHYQRRCDHLTARIAELTAAAPAAAPVPQPETDGCREALRLLVEAVIPEVNEKGAGGYLLARLADARDVLAAVPQGTVDAAAARKADRADYRWWVAQAIYDVTGLRGESWTAVADCADEYAIADAVIALPHPDTAEAARLREITRRLLSERDKALDERNEARAELATRPKIPGDAEEQLQGRLEEHAQTIVTADEATNLEFDAQFAAHLMIDMARSWVGADTGEGGQR